MGLVWATYARESIDKDDPDPKSNGTSCLVKVKRTRKQSLGPLMPPPRKVDPVEIFNPVLSKELVVVISGKRGYTRTHVIGRLKSAKEVEEQKIKQGKV